MAYVSNQPELVQALIANDPLIEIINSFTIDTQINIYYSVTIKSGCDTAGYSLTKAAPNTGSMFFVSPGSSLTIESLVIDGIQSSSNSALIETQGVLLLNNAVVRGAASIGSGGGIRVNSGGALTMVNSYVVYNTAQTGGGIRIDNGGIAKLINSGVDMNTAALNGGGIYVASGALLEAIGGSMNENTSGGEGGALYIEHNGVAKLSCDIVISGNTAATGGMGVYNGGDLCLAGNVYIRDGLFIPSRENAVCVTGPLSCSEIRLEESPYNNSRGAGAPYIVAVSTMVYPVLCPQDVCAFKMPCNFSGWFFSCSPGCDAVLLNIYPHYSITYENLLGAANINPTAYSECTLPLFLYPPTSLDDYLFEGWYIENPYGAERIVLLRHGTVGDIVLYAKWVRKNTVASFRSFPVGSCRDAGCGSKHNCKCGCGCDDKKPDKKHKKDHNRNDCGSCRKHC